MEFRNITTFLKVAELKNFSKAAEKLGYCQSTVTIQIQQLEKELNTQLFERVGKNIILTEKGKEFIFYANEILRAANKAISSIKNEQTSSDDLIGTLHIGSIESVSTALLPDILLAFSHICPKVETIVHMTGRDVLINEVRGNHIDLFFTLEKKRSIPGLNRILLQKFEIVFIAPAQFPLPHDSKIALKELVAMPFILTERGESYRYDLDQFLSEQNLEMHPILEIGNPETIVHLVEKGMGCSFLPLFSCKDALERGTVVQLDTDMPAMYMYSQLFYHKNKWVTPQMETFISIVQDTCRDVPISFDNA